MFDLVRHYLSNGAEAYVYWNAALEDGGISTWGWRQNSMFTVDVATGTVIERPEYQVMRHLARYVRPGAAVLRPEGTFGANVLLFRNSDGREVAVLQNPLEDELVIDVTLGGRVATVALPAKSFATVAV